MTTANSNSIQRWGTSCVCLLLAVSCAPDQFVSMGFDEGGAPSELGQSSGSTSGSNAQPSSNSGADGSGGTAGGGDTFGNAGESSGSTGSSAGLGGTPSNPSASSAGGDIGVVLRPR